jgi:hypothetical protein
MNALKLVATVKEQTDTAMDIVDAGAFSMKPKHQVLREIRVQLLNIKQALNNYEIANPTPPGDKIIA